jgi:tRNA G18 (ribose-2'-O)-methylase SpoU
MQTAFPESGALIVGNEATWLSSEFLCSHDFAVRIPEPGAVGSLIVAMATAIATHEPNRDPSDDRLIAGNYYHEKRLS